MILFLERDTSLVYPTGFENPQLNFFDPQEDHVRLACLKDKNKKRLATSSLTKDSPTDGDEYEDIASSDSEDSATRCIEISHANSIQSSPGIKGRKAKQAFGTKKKKKSLSQKYCIRPNCKRKPRFDSAFCSDACGVSTMETDLLRSLSFANNMHPYNLRN